MGGPLSKRGVTYALVALASTWAASERASATCTPSAGSLLYATQLHITGAKPVEVRIPVPSATEILVVVSEFGVDVRLRASVAPAGDAGIADNPARRFGPRRMILNTGPHQEVTFTVTGKDARDSRGTVRLESRLLASAGPAACIAADRLLAAGDRHYALAGVALEEESATPTSPAGPTAHRVDSRLEYRAAAETYAQAAAALAGLPTEPLVAQAQLFAAAVDYQNLKEYAAAARAAAASRAAFLASHDAYGAARAGAMEAAADMEQPPERKATMREGSEDPALTQFLRIRWTFLELARFHARRHQLFDEALALNNAGIAAYYAGQFGGAITTYRQALGIYTRLTETAREAQVLQNIALVEADLGRFPVSRRDFARALALIASDPPSLLRLQMLNNEALADYRAGDLDTALQHYGTALELAMRLRSAREQARSLHGLGTVYYDVGDRTAAFGYFTRALGIRSAALDPRGRTATLRALASVLNDLHEPARALDLRREALALAVRPALREGIETQMAGDLEAMGQRPEARSVIDGAVQQDDGSNRVAAAVALLARGQLNYDERRYEEARADAARALKLLRGAETPANEVMGLVLAARIARERHELAQARSFIDRALDRAEEIRVQSANPELRAGLWSSFRAAFDLKIDLLQQDRLQNPAGSGDPDDSPALDMLVAAERSRARSLIDYQSLHASATGSGDRAARDVQQLYDEIADRRLQLETRLDQFGDADSRVRAIRADIATLQREIDSLHHTTAQGGWMAATPESVRAQLSAVIERIPSDTAVVEYWVGTTQARAWVITRRGVRMVALGPSAKLDLAARALHAGLRSYSSLGQTKRAQLISDLSALVIAPLAPELLQYRSLVVVPDGALHYVPFAVLGTGAGTEFRYLVTDHVLLTAPSLTSAAWHDGTASRPTRILIVADPVYAQSDERLPATALEADSILHLAGHSGVDTLTGFDASRDSFLGRDLTQYRIIHIAAHGVLDTQAPQLSAIILSLRDAHGAVRPGEVFAGDFLSRTVNADLVVLSACDTALGRELAGEGLLGLRYALHAAGARSVIASLWEVPDRVAAELMAAFYTRYLVARDSPAQALTAAMREMKHRFTDPALWGAFEASATGSDGVFPVDQHNQSKDIQ